MGTWLGIFPTVETLLAQFLALAFVIGSYYAAEWVSKRRLRRLIEAAELKEAEEDAAGGLPDGESSGEPGIEQTPPELVER